MNQIPDIRSTLLGRRLVEVMAKGTLAFCRNNKIAIPLTYEEFESTVVQASRQSGFEGGIAFLDEEAGGEAVLLFSEPLGIDPVLMDLPIAELNERIKASKELQQKFMLLKTLLSGRIQEKGEAFNQLGKEFEPIAIAFKEKYCWRRAVFEAMRKID